MVDNCTQNGIGANKAIMIPLRDLHNLILYLGLSDLATGATYYILLH